MATAIHITDKQAHLLNELNEMAIAIFIDRIQGLSKADRDDLYELMPLLYHSEAEEREAAAAAFHEILESRPCKADELNLESHGGREPLKAYRQHVGERIKHFRENASMTQSQLADATGIQQSHISRLEKGEHSPSRVTIEKIAGALGIEGQAIDPSF